jgi:ribosomal protein S21
VIARVDELLLERNQNHEPISMPFFLEHGCPPREMQVSVGMDDFFEAIQELTPSLTREEIDRYARLREKFEGPSTKKVSKGKSRMV